MLTIGNYVLTRFKQAYVCTHMNHGSVRIVHIYSFNGTVSWPCGLIFGFHDDWINFHAQLSLYCCKFPCNLWLNSAWSKFVWNSISSKCDKIMSGYIFYLLGLQLICFNPAGKWQPVWPHVQTFHWKWVNLSDRNCHQILVFRIKEKKLLPTLIIPVVKQVKMSCRGEWHTRFFTVNTLKLVWYTGSKRRKKYN